MFSVVQNSIQEKSLFEFIRTWRQKAAQKCHYFTVHMVSHTKQLDCSYISLRQQNKQSYKSSIKLPEILVTGEKYCGLPVHLTYTDKLIQLPNCSNAF
jgi:hypothetical protein